MNWRPRTWRTWLVVGLVALLALVGTMVASESPDGLERVAGDLSFEHHAETVFEAPLQDYAVPSAPAPVSGPLAGVIGALLVGGLAFGAGRVLSRAKGRR